MAADASLQPLPLLSDAPIDTHGEDLLTRDQEARTIAEAVLGTPGPFSIGIYGQWGSGKTSLLNHVRSLLDARVPPTRQGVDPESMPRAHPAVVTVMFNAWKHERDTAPLAHLAAAVDAAITQRLKETQSIAGGLSEAALHWLRSAHLNARALAYGSALESRFDPTDELVRARGWQFWKCIPFAKFSLKDFIDRRERLKKEAGDPNSRVWKAHVDACASRSVLLSLDGGRKALAPADADPENRAPRVVVFIDDLDRCLPADAFALLQAIKLALAQPGFVFVMTLDPAALQPYIDNKAAEAGHRGGAESRAIYLDKLVQLPFPLQINDEQFTAFVNQVVDRRLKAMLVAPAQFEAADKDKSIAPLWQALHDLIPLLAVSSLKNPRTLIRRINAVLLDARLAPGRTKAVLDADPAKAEGAFVGLCLIRHTLRQFVGINETAALSADASLCRLIKERGLDRCLDRLAAVTSGRFAEHRTTPVRGGEQAGNEPGDTVLMQSGELLKVLRAWPRLDALFKTEAGQRWLGSADDRDLVETFLVKRPEAPTASQPPQSPPSGDGPTAAGAGARPSPEPQPTGGAPRSAAPLDPNERAIIERVIRGALDLPADTPLGPAEMARVTALNLAGTPITDAGAMWLSDPATGLKALTTLNLWDTKVTDAGVQALAHADTGLKALTALSLRGTEVKDAGVQALARADTGLKALTALSLRGMEVKDAGVRALARADTGLKALTGLDLDGTKVTDAGVQALAHADTGLKALTGLDLDGTKVTDAGVQALAHADTGLKVLTELGLGATKVTDAGVQALARADTGLKALTTLYLTGTQVGDAGVQALARADTGLKALTELHLAGTQVTDAGVQALARADTGLKALTTLYLSGTEVSDTGEEALRARFPHLTLYR